jgi:signal transduction histidine kinase
VTATAATVPIPVSRPRRVAVGALVAALVVLLGAWLRIVVEQPETPLRLLQPLAAVAALLGALVVRRRAPALTWVLLVTASLLATTVPIRAMQLVNAEDRAFAEWLPPALAVAAAVVGTTFVAALYATRPERRLGGWVVPVVAVVGGWLAAACLIVVVLVAAGVRADPAFTWADVATLPTTFHLHVVLFLVALGAGADVRLGLARADARLADESAGAVGWRERLRATVEELTPGVAERHERDVDAERRRLASDLHAVVLPSLRRAISEAERGAGAETLARRLRVVDRDLQRLLADRWPIVLETFGLVEALEELAEEVEADGPAVEIDVVDAEGRPPPSVERAAWRVAQLAVDNAVRHAAPGTIRITVAVRPERLSLEIADDGSGLADDALASLRTGGGRGLADQRRIAASIGGRHELGRSAGGGLAVRLVWATAGSSSVTRDG